jgi:predicted phage tail component-like protein
MSLGSFKFNGQDFSDLVEIISIDQKVLPEININAVDVGLSPGQRILSSKYGIRQIAVDVQMVNNVDTKKQSLAARLSTLEPKELIFNREPDKMYHAMPSGNYSLSGYPTSTKVTTTIDFYCYDPFAYSTDTVSATNAGEKASKSDNQLLHTAVPMILQGLGDGNDGAEPAYLGSAVTAKQWRVRATVTSSGSVGSFVLKSSQGDSIITGNCNGGPQDLDETFTFADGQAHAIDLQLELSSVPDTDNVSVTAAKAVPLDEDNDQAPDMTWSPAEGEDGYLINGQTLSITNPGTADAPVDLSAAMVDDLGYLAATINGQGVAVGNPNGQVTADGDKGSTMFETYFWTPYTLIQNKYPGKVSSTASLKGSWKQDNWKGVGFVYPDNYAEPAGASGQALYGTSFYVPFDKPRNHWAVNFHMLNYPLQNKTLGYTEMFAVDANGAPVFGYQFRKLNWANKYQQLILWIGDDIINTWTDDQHTSWIMEQFIGNLQLEQDGDAFTFRFRNDYTKAPWARTLKYSNLANQQVAGINFYTGKFGGCNGYYTHVMSMTGTSYDTNWVHTDNLFQQNSTVDINSDTAAPTVLINGVPALDTMVPTSQPLIVPANLTTEINIDNTISRKTPAVTATLRPRYI